MKNGSIVEKTSAGAKKYFAVVILFCFILAVFANRFPTTYFIQIENPMPFVKHFFNITGFKNILQKNDKRELNKIKHFICPAFYGKCGNQLFQYASSYGIARLKDMKVLINENCELLHYFNLKADIRKDTSICHSGKVKIIKEEHSAVFDKRLLEFNNTSDVRLTVYLQSFLYFDKYRKELHEQFTFKDEIRHKTITILESKLRKFNITLKNTYNIGKREYIQNKGSEIKDVTLIGVHIRRGDYIKYPERGYKVATKEYLQKAVDLYRARHDNPVFIVASNGMEWAKENMPKNIQVTYLEGNSAWLDMAIVTMCNHFIATVGTFSWWSAWLTGGNVTYYKWPAKEGSPFRKSFSKDYKDHYYSNWVGL